MAQIVLDHVEKAYPGGVKAVNDLSLDIKDGEFMVFVGPSGCGKSTALRSIAGLEEITAGTIQIGDRVVNDLPPKDRDIAMVFQNYALYPHMTVEQNLAFGLQLRKTPKQEIQRRVGEAARMLGLEPYLKRKPGALSGGQRQRVAMGRAIVREPQAFLMDEPLSNLDAKLRVSMRASLNQLHERLGVTTVYVTHDQVEAMTLGDRVAVMRSGLLQQVGSPKELYDSPVNLFVAGFIGSPAMNFMGGTLEDGKLRTSLGDFQLSDRLRRAVERESAGREVIVGLRPENFEDAAIVSADARPNGITFHTSIDVLESMGSDVFVYFTQAREQGVNAAELEELAKDSGRADTGASGDTVVARLDAATRIHEGGDAELWVDGRSMHVFDPATGRNLSLDADRGGAASSSAARSSTGSSSAGSSSAGSSAAGSDAATGSTTPAGPGGEVT